MTGAWHQEDLRRLGLRHKFHSNKPKHTPGTLLAGVKVEPPGELLQAQHGIIRFMSFFGFAALQILVSASALGMPSAPKYARAAMRRLKNTIVTL